MDKGVQSFAYLMLFFFACWFQFLPRDSQISTSRYHDSEQQWIKNKKLFETALREWSKEYAQTQLEFSDSLFSPVIVHACSGNVVKYQIGPDGKEVTTTTPKTIVFLSTSRAQTIPEILNARLSLPSNENSPITEVGVQGFASPLLAVARRAYVQDQSMASKHGSLEALRLQDERLGTRAYEELFEDASEICLNPDNDLEHFLLDARDFRADIEQHADLFISMNVAVPSIDTKMLLYYHSPAGVKEAELPLSISRAI